MKDHLKFLAAATVALSCVMFSCGAGAASAEETRLFTPPAAGSKPYLLPEDRRWTVSFDFDYRRRKIRPAKVTDRYDDYVGDIHFTERLDLDLYKSEDSFQLATAGLTVNCQALKRLEVYASLRRPIYSKVNHRDLNYDEAPLASPQLEVDHGGSLELAGGFWYRALQFESGPLRHCGLKLGGEYRAGWGDDITCPNEEDQFAVDGNDKLEYESKWQSIDLELRAFKSWPDTIDGVITAYLGTGISAFYYHEEWDGSFENGDEKEVFKFDYREQNIVFGSGGLRVDHGRLTIDIGGRYGGEALLHTSLGWKF